MPKARAILLLVLAWLCLPAAASAQQGPGALPIHPATESVQVGRLVYRVHSAWWMKLPAPGGGEAAYLFVDLSVANTGPGRAQIPPFKLVDSLGNMYEMSWSKIVFPTMALDSGAAERGRIVFLPRPGGNLWLMASSDYDSAQFAYIEIAPAQGAEDR